MKIRMPLRDDSRENVLTSCDTDRIVSQPLFTLSEIMISPKMKQLMDELRQRENLIELLKEANHLMVSLRTKVRQAEEQESPRFVIPKEFSIIAPLVETYYDDHHGWYLFLRTLRDESGWSTKEAIWRKVHEMMRDAHSNYSQYTRRTLSGLAADLLEKERGSLKRGQRSTYMKYVLAVWTEQRTKLENQLRAKHPGEHLPNDLRQDAIDAFWETVKADIEKGKIPPTPDGFDD